MKTISKLILVGIIAFAIGAFSNNVAYSVNNHLNIAVVNIKKVVQNYSKVNALKTEQKAKLNDLKKFVKDARAKIAGESDVIKKKALEDKYNKELNKKRSAMNLDYTKKLKIINKNITKVINKTAKNKQIDLVLTKNSVLYGGKDITNDILKSLK